MHWHWEWFWVMHVFGLLFWTAWAAIVWFLISRWDTGHGSTARDDSAVVNTASHACSMASIGEPQ
jgi:hypothetical protein